MKLHHLKKIYETMSDAPGTEPPSFKDVWVVTSIRPEDTDDVDDLATINAFFPSKEAAEAYLKQHKHNHNLARRGIYEVTTLEDAFKRFAICDLEDQPSTIDAMFNDIIVKPLTNAQRRTKRWSDKEVVDMYLKFCNAWATKHGYAVEPNLNTRFGEVWTTPRTVDDDGDVDGDVDDEDFAKFQQDQEKWMRDNNLHPARIVSAFSGDPSCHGYCNNDS